MTHYQRPDINELRPPERRLMVWVTESDVDLRAGWSACSLGGNIQFSTQRLESYFFKRWNVLHFDMLLVAAAIEFCDMSKARPALSWSRDIHLNIPVHDPELWSRADVSGTLHQAIQFLTGDRWTIRFRRGEHLLPAIGQAPLELGAEAKAVIPFSNGLDSCSVADLKSRELGSGLVRIRLGTDSDMQTKDCRRVPFANVPYSVKGERNEQSMRSRGFKFGLVSGLAAFLADAPVVIMPESGQGALGPTLAPLGQSYPDYRTHPSFLRRMERFLQALLGQTIAYELPRLWSTKGETLTAHLAGNHGGLEPWRRTRSCWQQSRHVAVSGQRRQCGICAACLLRRMSVHAAGQVEAPGTYAWNDLSASTFEGGATPDFDRAKITGKLREYAIAGALHLDHLAAVRRSGSSAQEVDLHVFQLAYTCGISPVEAQTRLNRLLDQHENEWTSYLASLRPTSFLRQWVGGK